MLYSAPLPPALHDPQGGCAAPRRCPAAPPRSGRPQPSVRPSPLACAKPGQARLDRPRQMAHPPAVPNAAAGLRVVVPSAQLDSGQVLRRTWSWSSFSNEAGSSPHVPAARGTIQAVLCPEGTLLVASETEQTSATERHASSCSCSGQLPAPSKPTWLSMVRSSSVHGVVLERIPKYSAVIDRGAYWFQRFISRRSSLPRSSLRRGRLPPCRGVPLG